MSPRLAPPFVPPFRLPLPPHYSALYCSALAATILATVLGVVWRRRRRRAGRSTWPADLCLSLCLSCLLLVLAEGLFFRFADLSDSFANSNSGRLWFSRHVRENNWGYRDDVDYTFRPAPGKQRIVFLGDSFTLGHGVRDVEDRFANRIRRRLEQAAPGRYEVYALCYPGWSTRREGALLGRLPRTGFRAEWIVLAYVPNDAIDLPELVELDRQNIAAMARLQPRAWILRNSYLPNFLYFRLRVMRAPEVRDYYDWARRGFESPHWEQHRADLSHLPSLSARLGARFAVVTFPFLHGLGPDYAYADAHRKLDALWQAQRVPHVDLREIFGRHAPADLMVSRFDAHPNPLAHRLAAEEIYRRILAPALGLSAEPEDGPAR